MPVGVSTPSTPSDVGSRGSGWRQMSEGSLGHHEKEGWELILKLVWGLLCMALKVT